MRCDAASCLRCVPARSEEEMEASVCGLLVRATRGLRSRRYPRAVGAHKGRLLEEKIRQLRSKAPFGKRF